MIPLEADGGEPDEELDHLPAAEPAVGLGQMQRHLEVAQGDDRLDAVLVALVEEVIVELQTGFVGFQLVAVGEDAGPCDAGAEALEAHLREQPDVLLVVVVEVDGFVVGIILARLDAVGDPPGSGAGAGRDDVHDAQALAALIVAAFQLMRGHCAAPEKIVPKGHDRSPPFLCVV